MNRLLLIHGAVTLMLIKIAATLLGTPDAGALWRRLGGHLATFAASGLIAAIIMLAGRKPTGSDLVLAGCWCCLNGGKGGLRATKTGLMSTRRRVMGLDPCYNKSDP